MRWRNQPREVDRLDATVSEAAELGLHIRLQPTLGDRPASEILDHLIETGRHLERLRRRGARYRLRSASTAMRAAVPMTASAAGSVAAVWAVRVKTATA